MLPDKVVRQQLSKVTCYGMLCLLIKYTNCPNNKYTGAQEIMQRIRYGYELCLIHVRAGVTNYNKGPNGI